MTSLTVRRNVQFAWFGWVTLFFVIAAMIVAGNTRVAIPAYWKAALHWINGVGLYDGSGIGGFVYLPQAAILFVPFALLPRVLCEAFWRVVNIGTFAIGLRNFSQHAGERSGIELFPLMTLVTIPFAWDCARNGQATLAMTGLMLLAVGDVAHSRWWRATLWLSLGLSLKPLIIVLVLLIMVIERPMTWRVFLGMVAMALAPFLVQHPGYVLQQYSACLHNTTTAAHVGVVANGWSTPFTALRVAGIEVPEFIQTLCRLIAAFITLVLCIVVRRRHHPDRYTVYLFSLAATYIILFSPRTETVTYALLGPAIAVFLSQAILIEKRVVAGILLTGIALALICSGFVQPLLAPHAEAIWLPPLMASCFALYLLYRFFTDPKRGQNKSGQAI
jgi:alpha-1,2-mannosyltransferase